MSAASRAVRMHRNLKRGQRLPGSEPPPRLPAKAPELPGPGGFFLLVVFGIGWFFWASGPAQFNFCLFLCTDSLLFGEELCVNYYYLYDKE
ncbi:rCG49242 [Rattus norvegicus]|uniref:RCG49242 n=1 Tax=Rattus norvegicus TaxID=10116 RepID=A6J3E7_RAT|nr:rCG49242 [Rattus norvegicus]